MLKSYSKTFKQQTVKVKFFLSGYLIKIWLQLSRIYFNVCNYSTKWCLTFSKIVINLGKLQTNFLKSKERYVNSFL